MLTPFSGQFFSGYQETYNQYLQSYRLVTRDLSPVQTSTTELEGLSVRYEESTVVQGLSLLQKAAIGPSAATPIAQYQSISGPTSSSQTAASTILNFIAKRLEADMADGATQEELQSRLEAGLSGFKSGYGEALEALEFGGLLDSKVQQAVDSTFDKVLAGVSELAERYSLVDPVSSEEPPVAEGIDNALLANPPSVNIQPERSRPAEPLGAAMVAYDYESNNSFSFNLKTQDGDLVTIQAHASFSQSSGAVGVSDLVQQASYAHGQQNQAQGFALDVQGELDADELKAINDLLGQVNKVSELFFRGDAFAAFEQALDLGYNREEISRFSLNLKQIQVERVVTTYNNIAKLGQPGGLDSPNSQSSFGSIAQFIDQLQRADEQASYLSSDVYLVRHLAEFISLQDYAKHPLQPRFAAFVQELIEESRANT